MRNRTISSLTAVLMVLLFLPTATAQLPAQLPDPDGKPPSSYKPVEVYVLAGQSNMLQFGEVEGDRPGTLETLTKRDKKFQHLVDEKGNWTTRKDVYYYDARDEFKGEHLSVGRTIGPELQFGHVMGHFHDEQVLIIKTAKGNRALALGFRPPSSGKLPDVPENLEELEGREYRWMVESVRKTLDNIEKIVPYYTGQGYRIAGFAWFQGHKDGTRREWTDEYERNLVNLIEDVRAEFKTPKLPVVIATVGFRGAKMSGRYLKIHTAQMAVGGKKGKYPQFAGNVLSVDTRGFWRSPEVSPNPRDGSHYFRNAESYMLVGDALGRGMVSLLKQQ